MHTPDQQVVAAIKAFLERLPADYSVMTVILFGSRAAGTNRPDSDVDVAIVFRGRSGHRVREAVRMAAIAFDIMLETGLLIEPIPFWEDEWEHPETFTNPTLIENIRCQGVRL